MAETTTLIELAPPAAIVPPLKLQVMRPLALLHAQFVPAADTNVRPAGSWSLT